LTRSAHQPAASEVNDKTAGMAQFGVCYMPTDKHKIRTVKHSPHRCHFTGKKTKVGKYVGPMVTDNAAIHMELQNPKPDV